MSSFAKARTNMVDCQIHPNGVIDPRILNAFETLPREKFIPSEIQSIAYNDEGITLDDGRSVLEPQVHARMVQLLSPSKDDVALVIGDASGYASAVMASIVGTVLTLEENADKTKIIENNLQALDVCNFLPVENALNEGAPDKAPYDIIFINGAVAEVPQVILDQMADGGRLVAIVKGANKTMGDVTLYERSESNKFSSYVHFTAGCPYLNGFEPKSEFSF